MGRYSGELCMAEQGLFSLLPWPRVPLVQIVHGVVDKNCLDVEHRVLEE